MEKKNEPTVSIILTEEDAELFKKFREFQDNFNFLVRKGAFEVRDGSFTVHCNHEKRFMQVDVFTISKREKEYSQKWCIIDNSELSTALDFLKQMC